MHWTSVRFYEKGAIYIAGGPAYYVLHPQKGIKDLVILVSQNNLWTNSLIRVQGDCPCILFSSYSELF